MTIEVVTTWKKMKLLPSILLVLAVIACTPPPGNNPPRPNPDPRPNPTPTPAPPASADRGCTSDERFNSLLFEENEIDIAEYEFAEFDKSDIWNEGVTGNNPNFFKPGKYLKVKASGKFGMSMDVFRPNANADDCSDRPVVLLLHGGGYAPLAAAKDQTNDRDRALYLARAGYVVALLDYRKGWDIKNALAKQSAPPLINLPLLPGVQNGPCEGPCDTYSFSQMTYNMVQDVRAGHRFLKNHSAELGIDGSKVFYWGASTGAVGVINAAYGAEEFAQYKRDDGKTMEELEGGIDAFGESHAGDLNVIGLNSFAGAIKQVEWMNAADNVPMIITHGRVDEAVKYCNGRILDMKYRNTNNLKHLMLAGPGPIYDRAVAGQSAFGAIELHTYKGLFHSLGSRLLNPVLANNCNERDELHEILQPHLDWMDNILRGGSAETRHFYYANAPSNVVCVVERRDEKSDCN